MTHRLLHRCGPTGWRAGVRIQDHAGTISVVDVLFPAERPVIEIDSYAHHGDLASFVQDRRRQNRLTNAGYTVLRFTWSDLTEQPERVVTEIRGAPARLSA